MGAGGINLIKLSVGIENPAHLARVQQQRLRDAAAAGREPKLFHVTRNRPRRAEELLAGGSIYWVIKGRIRLRQRLLGIETDNDQEGRRICRLVLDPPHVETETWRCRAFQGWRYLAPDSAPPDLETAGPAEFLPVELASELRELGLI